MKKLPKIPAPSKNQLEKLMIDIENPDNKRIVVFDLDETLVHCESNNFENCEIILPFHIKSSFKKLGINLRPNLKKALLEIKKYFLIVVYTASHKILAEPILDFIDPQKTIFSSRLYRHNCYQTMLENEIIYIKDLRIFNNFDLKNILIVDNCVISFTFQLDNGIPMLPFYNNKNDDELMILVNYLQHLNKFEDMRVENKRVIKLDCLFKYVLNDNYFSEESKNSKPSMDSNQNSIVNSNNSKMGRNLMVPQNLNFSSSFSVSNDFSENLIIKSSMSSYKNSSINTNQSDKSFRDQMCFIIEEYKKNFK